jgi:uncharacterized protein (TIGR03437 family)
MPKNGLGLGKLLWVTIVAFPLCLPAQQTTCVIRISTTAPDATFQVDDQWVTGAQVFAWPTGSKHTLQIPILQYTLAVPNTRYSFQYWDSAAGQLLQPGTQVVITADPRISWYKAQLLIEYDLSLVFNPCVDPDCPSPGIILVAIGGGGGSIPCPASTDFWAPAGSTVILEAVPGSGFTFAGWWQQSSNGPNHYTFTLNAPVWIYPHFARARPIALHSDPDGFQLLADGVPVYTPITLEWGWGSSHTLGVVSPQQDSHGARWVFASWSDGRGGANRTYEVDSTMTEAGLVARFVRPVGVDVLSEPLGLALVVDGLSAKTPQAYYWVPGEGHTLNAPLRLTDSLGSAWAFRAWSNGSGATQTIQPSESQVGTGVRLTAQYDPLGRIHVDSVPSGLVLRVDDFQCRTPCDVERPAGSQVRMSASATLPGPDGARYDLEGWDGAEGGTLIVSSGLRHVTARYSISYRLNLSSRPARSGTWQVSPSIDGYYKAGSAVNVAFAPLSGTRFLGWELDLSGSDNPATVWMNGPRSVQAVTEELPPPPPILHISNAATDTNAVTPGSLASLFGAGLTRQTATASTDPLPQTLGGVTLRCANKLVPLLFVSPEQINFQVPSSLEPGDYQLEIHPEAGSTLSVKMTVAPHAPGLFLAAHVDGRTVSPENPTVPGEHLMLYGTGLGLYSVSLPDGFRVAAGRAIPLTEPVQAFAGDHELVVVSSVAAPGLTGITLVEVVLPDDLDTTTLPTTVVSGGVGSNTLDIPVAGS